MEVMRDEDGTTYRPVIRYRGNDGDLYDGQTHISSSEYNFPIGSEVEILVEDGVRDTVRIDGWFSIWGVPLVFTIFRDRLRGRCGFPVHAACPPPATGVTGPGGAGGAARRPFWVLGALLPMIFGAIGAIFTVIGAVWLLLAMASVDASVPVTGEVVSVADTGRGFRAEFTYTDQGGMLQTGRTHISSSAYDFALGTRIDLLVDPSDPETVRVDGWFSLWGLPAVFLVLGGTLFATALILFLIARQLRRSRP